MLCEPLDIANWCDELSSSELEILQHPPADSSGYNNLHGQEQSMPLIRWMRSDTDDTFMILDMRNPIGPTHIALSP